MKSVQTALTLAALLLCAGPALAADEIDWQHDIAKTVKAARDGEKMLLVFITGPIT